MRMRGRGYVLWAGTPSATRSPRNSPWLGAPLKAIQELLGYATIQMTMRFSPEIVRNAVQMLDRRSNLSQRGSVVAATRFRI